MQTLTEHSSSEIDLLSKRIGVLAAELMKVQADLTHAFGQPSLRQGLDAGARYGAIRATILQILRDHPTGIRSRDIQQILRLRMAGEMGLRTHATTLSRLKSEGLARKGGGYWSLS